MRRRFKGKSFSRGGKFARQRVAWDAFQSNEFAHLLTNVAVESVIFTTDAARPLAVNERIKVRRVIGDFRMTYTPTSAALTFDSIVLFWALLTRDADDTDITLIGTGEGSLIASQRVLQVGCEAYSAESVPTGQYAGVGRPPLVIKFDWRGQCWMKAEEELLLMTQWGNAVNTTLADARLSGIARTLYDVP